MTGVTRRDWGLDLIAVATLWLLVLLVFWLIGPAGRVLAGGDLFSYFYPYWAEASRALRAGRLPLWNSHLFMGVPLLANSQVGTLYPLNWPLWLLLTPHRALHWSVIIHLGLAATGVYVHARDSLRLGRMGAWAAGATLAVGGYLGAQVEHINQLQALSWFPWLLVLYDRAVNRRGALAPVGLATATGMTLLAGHTQAAFIVLVGVMAYALLPNLEPDGPTYRRRIGLWATAMALGALLAAVQLVPMFQLAQHSIRAQGLPFNERVSFSLSPVYLARALLPGYSQAVEPEKIEYIASVGVGGLALAAAACLTLARGWREAKLNGRSPLWRIALLAALGLFLALGLYNPIYLLLARFVPGFAHFRAPARWLALWAFGGAVMIGAGAEYVAQGKLQLNRRQILVGSALLIGLFVWGALGGRCDTITMAGWCAAALLTAGLVWLSRRGSRVGAWALVALVVAELALSARTLPHARATAPQAYTSLRPAAAHLLVAGQGREPADRFLSISALEFDPGDLEELRLIYGPQLSPDALYNLIVATKHREVLSPNLALALGVPAADGYGGGVLPMARYVALQRAFLPPSQVSLDGRLRENLTQIPDGRWLSLFNVRYIITDKVLDAWLDDVFYDLQFSARLEQGERAEVAHIPPFEATALGLVSYLDGAESLEEGATVGVIEVGFDDGPSREFPLRAGIDTAEGLYDTTVTHSQAQVGGHFWPGQPEGNDYVTRLRWDDDAVPTSVSVRATLPRGELVVRGVSLIDERTGSFQSLVLSDQGRFRLVHSGDVKVYENLDVLERAFVLHQAQAVEDGEAAEERMTAPDFDPLSEVVVEGAAPLDTAPGAPEEVEIISYTPSRVEIEADLSAPGYLVLTDANYPGWRVRVDGEKREIATADLLFRAVELEAGEHHVVFTFQPQTLRVGAALTLLGLIGLVGLAAIRVYNQRVGRRG